MFPSLSLSQTTVWQTARQVKKLSTAHESFEVPLRSTYSQSHQIADSQSPSWFISPSSKLP